MRLFSGTILFLLILGQACFAQLPVNQCTATLNDGTLTIKNDRLTVYYDLRTGDCQFSGYALSGREKVSFDQKQSDLQLSASYQTPNAAPKFSTQIRSRLSGESDFLEVSLEWRLNKLLVKRIWEVYPGLPAISSYYLFKGEAGAGWLSTAKTSSSPELIEDIRLLSNAASIPYFGVMPLHEPHWKAKIVSFSDATDHHNNLVHEYSFLPYLKSSGYTGNILLLQHKQSNTGIFLLKESPLGKNQQSYPGYDFIADHKKVLITGPGLSSSDIKPGVWTRSYTFTLGFSEAEETAQLLSLRLWQKNVRPLREERDEMIMSNTWGDRSKDGKMNEVFILKELEAAARLGITHFQLDDGWQAGLSKNSAEKQGQRWNNWSVADWEPHKTRFPNGFGPIVKKAKEVGIALGLWFNPGSGSNYRDWEQSANILISYYQKYDIRVFKIDGVELPNKESEMNLDKFFQYVSAATNGAVVFNLDVTAGQRGGYFYFNRYGNVFLENRYTDWGNYYPHQTLRNLWQLSRYMPVERLQAEWLNSWRNQSKYPPGDPLAPARMKWDYLMATTFAAQPLAWMEVSNLPAAAFEEAHMLKAYRKVQHDMHQGTILPIGDEPDGFSWTGFQSLGERKGYFLIFREYTTGSERYIKTHLKPGTRVRMNVIAGSGASFRARVNGRSEIKFKLPSAFNYALYRYEVD